MSNGALKLLAGAGAGDDPVYVDDLFSCFLYEGASATNNIVNNIDVSGEGGLVWLKHRVLSGASATSNQHHQLYDTERGASYSLNSNRTSAQDDTGSVMTFNNNGFTLSGSNSVSNRSGNYYVSWTFRKAEKFFDVVTYTGDGSTNKTISHNLGSTPGMIIVKCTSASYRWNVWHRSLTNATTNTNPSNAYILKLETTDAEELTSSGGIADVNGSTFDVGGVFANNTGETFVAYLFAHNNDDGEYGEGADEDIIKCGKYTGTGSSLNVDLGFEPQWVMIKRANASDDWVMYDVMRGMPVGSDSAELNPNASYAENGYFGSSQPDINPYASGFTLQGTSSAYNNSASTYIYMAIRRPHKPASEFAATDLFAVNSRGAVSPPPSFYSGFVVDTQLRASDLNSSSDGTVLFDRLRGDTKALQTYSTQAESTAGSTVTEQDQMEGIGSNTGVDTNDLSWMWRRAPGYFDVVCYKGTGSNTYFNHNLGVVPEMIWFKARDYAEHWNVFTTGQGTASRLRLNEGDEARTNDQNQFWSTLPSATQFRVNSSNEINDSSYNYIAYLFASVAGISKLGTYAGTGSAQNIDCGFSAGARLVLIKRVDVAGYWMVWDSVRGIVAGNDPYLFLNTTAAQNSSYDYIDPLSSGFTITSSAPADNSDTSMNKSGGTYFFYAIA